MNQKYDHIHRQYFPFTNKCPYKGTCRGKDCKLWIGEKLCWHNKFRELEEDFWGEFAAMGYIHIKNPSDDKWHDAIRHLHIQMQTDIDNSNPPTMEVAFGFTSERLADEVRKKFKMLNKWRVEGRNYEGGDDHDLETTLDGSPSQEAEILKYWVRLKRLIPKIIEFEKYINNCEMCKSKAESLTKYGRHAICYPCTLRIINENIEKYFKGFIK